MLSVLIPVYNFDVRLLVKDLHKQAMLLHVPVEIILADDASDLSYHQLNLELQSLELVRYIILDKNIGRSRIRNLLAEKALYPNLIFMDCDSQTASSEYLKMYFDYFTSDAFVICGGRIYEPKKPVDKFLYLRWLYGVRREVIPVGTRAKNPYKSFMTNNFAISKQIFNLLKFDENLKGYGHEDTIFGLELERLHIPIMHINNPLFHTGLEPSTEFITKTQQGLKNLVLLLQTFPDPEILIQQIKIASSFKKIKKLRLNTIVIWLFIVSEKILLKNLSGKRPSLFLFDCYKIGFLCKSFK